MQTSLTPAFKKLQIDDDKPKALATPHNVTPVPRDAAYIDRYYLYGWTVTGKWLQDVAIRYKSLQIFCGLRTPSDGLLFLHSIYKDIHLVNALVEPGDTYPEADTYFNHDGDKMTMMVCIFTNVKELQHRRATEGQLLKLIEVFGREPRWYKDGWKMDRFLDYDFFGPS